MTEALRQKRNRLQEQLSACKASGRDPTPIIRKMRNISAEIKALEKENDQTSKKPPASAENREIPIVAEELFEWCSDTKRVEGAELTFRCVSLNSATFEEELKKILLLEKNEQVFPQNRSPWVLSWADSIGARNIYLVLIERQERPIAYCWLALRKLGPLRVLQSAPIHFCDFYDLASAENIPVAEIASILADGFKTIRCDLIWLRNINNFSKFQKILTLLPGWAQQNYHPIQTRWLSANQSPMNRLSSRHRYSIRSKRRRIEQRWGTNALSISEIETHEEYLKFENDFAAMHRDRWGNEIPQDARERRSSALGHYLESKDARVFCLFVAGKLAAYKIGFVFRDIFWEWKSCSLTEFNDFSINDIFLHDLLEELQSQGVKAYNFMAGDYEYKRRWGDSDLEITNSDFVRANSRLGSVVFRVFKHANALGEALSRRSKITLFDQSTGAGLVCKLQSHFRQFGAVGGVKVLVFGRLKRVLNFENFLFFELPRKALTRAATHPPDMEVRALLSRDRDLMQEALQREARANETVFVALRDGELRGYALTQAGGHYTFGAGASMTVPKDVVLLKGLFVFPEERGNRIGYYLNEARIAESHCGDCAVYVSAMSENRAALRNLRKIGFREVAEVTRWSILGRPIFRSARPIDAGKPVPTWIKEFR